MSPSPNLLLSLVWVLPVTVIGSSSSCKPFHEIYSSGRDLCNKMFDNSFEYIENGTPSNAYTMWFFDADNNPNDATAGALKGGKSETCNLQ